MAQSIYISLSNKYGKGKSENDPNSTILSRFMLTGTMFYNRLMTWNIPQNSVVTMSSNSNHSSNKVTYIDEKFMKQNKTEISSKIKEKTKKALIVDSNKF